MSDTLVVFGQTFTGVEGFKAKDNNGNIKTYGGGGGNEDPFIEKTFSSSTYINNRVSQIGTYVFASVSGLESVEFDSCKKIYGYAFCSCRDLVTASFPNCETISERAFMSCPKLETIYAPKTSSIAAYAFHSLSKLSNITLSSLYFVGDYGLDRNSFLSSVPLATTPLSANNIMIGAYAFASCTALSGEIIGGSYPSGSWAYGYLIGQYAFMSCSLLTKVSLAYAERISGSAFMNCSGISTVSISRFKGYDTFSGTNYAFCGCTGLQDVFIGSRVVGNEANGYARLSTAMFMSCYSLSRAIFTDLGTIASSVFYNCYNLLSLYILSLSNVSYAASYATLGNKNALTSTPIAGYTGSTGGVYGSIFVPEAAYSTYIAATNWVTYSDRFVSMTDAEISAFLSSL